MRQAGFSWIELLSVVAVVAILALMAIPSLQESALKKQVKEGMGLADVALSELIAGKLSYESVPGVLPDNSFVPIVTFPGARPEKKAA